MMNAKSLYAACLFGALSFGAISAHADTKTSDARDTGSALSIKKVQSWSQEAFKVARRKAGTLSRRDRSNGSGC